MQQGNRISYPPKKHKNKLSVFTALAFLLAAALIPASFGCSAGSSGTVQNTSPTGSAGQTGSTAPATAGGVTLKTDIDLYTPSMSSAFGIHIFATDSGGNPVKGNWTATWGQFCTATQDNGWKISEPKAEWDDASDIWWQFSTVPNPNGEMPSAVSVYFNGGGGGQTLLLEKCGPMTLKVSGTDATWPPAPSPTPAASAAAGTGVSLGVYPSMWCPAVSSARFVHLSATDENGVPMKGDWTATRGAFILPPFRNADGSVSEPDQQPQKELKDMSDAGWLLPEGDRKEGGSIEVRFSHGGEVTVLFFNWDSGMGLLSVGERFAAFSADEVRIIKEFSALVRAGKSARELVAYCRENIGKLNNGLGPVLADGILNILENNRVVYSNELSELTEGNYDALAQLENTEDFNKISGIVGKALTDKLKPIYDNGYMIRFTDGEIYADINWNLVKPAFAGKEGDDIRQYISIIQREDEKPFVEEGFIEITTDEMAKRYVDARDYAAAYPLRDDWHLAVEQYGDEYLSSLLTLNGRLFSGDGFTTPNEYRTEYDGIIQTYASDGLGVLFKEYKSLLEKAGWTLTNDVRDFLTLHGVAGYGRLES